MTPSDIIMMRQKLAEYDKLDQRADNYARIIYELTNAVATCNIKIGVYDFRLNKSQITRLSALLSEFRDEIQQEIEKL